jgi:hypothetical protein
MNNSGNKIKTKLSAHIWELKDRGSNFEIKWDFIDQATVFNPKTRKCRLSLKEKYHIMSNTERSKLNKQSKICNTCIHRTQKLLINVKT